MLEATALLAGIIVDTKSFSLRTGSRTKKKAINNYTFGKRSSDWLKVINYQYETVYVSGLWKNEFDLQLNFADGRYAGVMEFMNPQSRNNFTICIKIM